MSITLQEIAPGTWGVAVLWPEGTGVRINLKLTDPDGDVDERQVEWIAAQHTPLSTVLQTLAQTINALPHWRGSRTGGQITIVPASADYAGEVNFEVYEV